MSGIKVTFKLDAKAMLRRMGAVKFMNAARRWGRDTAVLLELRAKQHAPVDMGQLHRSITHRVIEMGPNIIARTGSNVKYAPYQEFGTGLHGPRRQMYTIRPRKKRALAFNLNGAMVVVQSVRHPGVKPKRFFAKALTEVRPLAERRLDEEIKRELEKQ